MLPKDMLVKLNRKREKLLGNTKSARDEIKKKQ